MKEQIAFKNMEFGNPDGRYTIELFDPRTKKLKERINGKNAVFPQSIFSNYSNVQWIDSLNLMDVLTVLSNDNTDVDLDIPFIFDPILGYGRPTNGGSGIYRGGYVSANQILGQITMSSVYWKWQYEFTASQANGIIRSIGLTNQFYPGTEKSPFAGFRQPFGTLLNSSSLTTDGRYSYSCSTAGIVTIIDMYLNTSTTVDVSAVVGTVTSNAKYIGYAPVTGKFYIFVYSSIADNRKVHVFTDNTFVTNEISYTVTNLTSTNIRNPFYVYGNKIFSPVSNNGNRIDVSDFITNELLTPISITPSPIIVDLGGPSTTRSGYCTCPIKDGYLYLGASGSSTNYQGCIFDYINEVVVAMLNGVINCSGAMLYPFPQGDKKLPCLIKPNSEPIINTAYTKSVLASPVEKTSSYSMTVTYELEIPWVAT